ncbi:MAG: TIGR03085 family protein [Dermatophilaceae bacterium]|nr:TIGR03085 family protein [Dermatophilaceae bacterium]MBP9918420.1 TIGR03085 family protein [Dermatophilaceae bacterium]
MTNYAQAERHALCDLMLRLGPDAPTLCHPWRTRELAAHLRIRETRPDLAIGMLIKPLEGRLDSATESMAQGDFEALVTDVRNGPPKWTPAKLSLIDQAINAMEFFIHHEDVLRAQPDWRPRVLTPGHEVTVWGALVQASMLLYRRAEVGVILETPLRIQHPAHGPGQAGTVVIKGPVSELALFSYGRKDVAQVSFDGPSSAVAAIKAARLSMP